VILCVLPSVQTATTLAHKDEYTGGHATESSLRYLDLIGVRRARRCGEDMGRNDSTQTSGGNTFPEI